MSRRNISTRQTESLLARGLTVTVTNVRVGNEGIHNSHSTQAANDHDAEHFPPGPFSNQNIIYKTPGIRLPTIELPKFSGEAAEWLSFRDTFESLINKNETIDPIQKFHYLKASLEGSASQIIKSLEFTAVNYAVA